jgi:membrane-associated phospholipid phosphatase
MGVSEITSWSSLRAAATSSELTTPGVVATGCKCATVKAGKRPRGVSDPRFALSDRAKDSGDTTCGNRAGHPGNPAITNGRKFTRGLRYRWRVLITRTSTPGRVLRAVAAGGAATVLASWGLGKLAQRDSVTRPSRRLYGYCREHRSATVTRRLNQVVTTIGDYSVIAPFSALVGGMLAYERREWTPLSLLASGFVSEVYLQKALQQLVNGTLPPVQSSEGPPGDYPSGGAARTVITFGLLAHMLTQRWSSPAERRAIWSIVAVLVVGQGGSRLYLGRHWPEDILGGWVFGWLVLRTLTRVDELISTGACAAPL